MTYLEHLERTVIAGGYCIGCGACASIDGSVIRIMLNANGEYQAMIPTLAVDLAINVLDVCPFSDQSESENQISKRLFGDLGPSDPNIGHYGDIYAGHVEEGAFRDAGSSGGFGTWIGHELLRTGRVDYIVSVSAQQREGAPLFRYSISDQLEEVARSSGSRYYPVQLSEVLAEIRQRPGRYAVVGLPCFIKAVRLLQRNDPLFQERITFTIGLICGHLKSNAFAESLAWQCGLQPGTLRSIDFRTKLPDRPADDYGVTVSDGAVTVTKPIREMTGSDWGAGAFKYKACDFCDDVFAETADVTLGDAWLPKYTPDSRGTNILVVRHPELRRLIADARQIGRLALEDLSVKDAVLSQGGGLRHRKDAISYRLYLEQVSLNWTPRKRRRASKWSFARYERRTQDERMRLRDVSKAAFRQALAERDLEVFTQKFRSQYRLLKGGHSVLFGRALAWARRRIRQIP